MGSHLRPSGVPNPHWAMCAVELQDASGYKGKVYKCPLYDDGHTLTRKQAQMAHKVARRLASQVRAGEPVLITCAMGKNRSGLVTALVVRDLTGVSGCQAVEIVKGRRKGAKALTNPVFVQYLCSLP